MLNPYLPIGLDTTARMIAEEANRVGEAAFDVRPDPERFSFREVIAHLADWEPIMLGRIKAAVETPGSTVQPYDEWQWAIDHDYASQDPREKLEDFRKARAETTDYVTKIPREKMANTVIHPERGTLTAADIAHTLVCHDLYHIVQLRSMTGGESA